MTRIVQATWLGAKYALDRPAVDLALETLRTGGLIVYPTDTLYGLGADASNEAAVQRVIEAKRRPSDQTMSVTVHGLPQIEAWAEVGDAARQFLATNTPGPYTVVLRPKETAPAHLISSLGIAFRIPAHPIPALLTRQFGPVTGTSANRHGEKAPTDVEGAVEQLGEVVALYIDAGPCEHAQPSSVIDFTEGRPKVIRQGAVR